MEQTPFDLVSTAVELICTLLVIGFIGTLLAISMQMTKSYQRETDIANSMQEYATFTKYDGTLLSGSDAVEAIHIYAEPAFIVTIGSTSFTNGNYTLDALTGGVAPLIDLSKDYSCAISIGTNGDINGITFTEVP